MSQSLLNDSWIDENFDGADFNDARLSLRLKKIASKVVKNPEASIPKQMGSWGDTKLAYEFFDNNKVTHKRIQTPHRNRVKELGSEITKEKGTVLFIQDGSEIDYSTHHATKGLGQIGNQFGKGLLIHSCLAVKFDEINSEVLGLAHQIVWERGVTSFSNKNSTLNGNKKYKESIVWSQTLKALGSPPEECQWVTVCDRGSDFYDFFAESKSLGWEIVSRAYKDRSIEVDGESTSLFKWVRNLPSLGTHLVEMRREGETKKREIEVQVTWGNIKLLPPERAKNQNKLSISVIRCWHEEEEIEWILYSTLKVSCLEEAIEKIKWYSCRWTIEEYHKCMKSGCKVEERYLQQSHALEALVGILSIIAVLLLQLRNLARDEEEGENPAIEVVPEIPLRLVSNWLKVLKESLSVREFWRGVARMGGFLGRKSDGEPGWQTLWKGWLELLKMWQGVEIFSSG